MGAGCHSINRELIFDELELEVAIMKLTQIDVPEEDKYVNFMVVKNTKGWRATFIFDSEALRFTRPICFRFDIRCLRPF